MGVAEGVVVIAKDRPGARRRSSEIKGGCFMSERFTLWAASLAGRIEELKSEDGQTFVEYALILAVVVVAVLLAVTWTGLGTAIQNAITQVSNAIGA
jgi:Flp pilus assembly pilin Flp